MILIYFHHVFLYGIRAIRTKNMFPVQNKMITIWNNNRFNQDSDSALQSMGKQIKLFSNCVNCIGSLRFIYYQSGKFGYDGD